eukprot:g1960.t1
MDEPADEIFCGSYGATNLTLHGIWPQYYEVRDGNLWPQYCKQDERAIVQDEVKSKMNSTWANVARSYLDSNDLKYHSLAQHEWERHGVCYSSLINKVKTNPLSENDLIELQLKFFKESIILNEKYPTPVLLQEAQKKKQTISLSDLQNAFGDFKVGLQCDGGNLNGAGHLSLVTLCVSREEAGGNAFDCPQNVLHDPYSNSCALSSETYSDIIVHFDCKPNMS